MGHGQIAGGYGDMSHILSIYGIYGLKFIHAIIWFNDFYVEDTLNIFVFLNNSSRRFQYMT